MSILCTPGCLGCSFCDEEIHPRDQKKEKTMEPLKVPLRDFLPRGCGMPLCNAKNGSECICAFNPF